MVFIGMSICAWVIPSGITLILCDVTLQEKLISLSMPELLENQYKK